MSPVSGSASQVGGITAARASAGGAAGAATSNGSLAAALSTAAGGGPVEYDLTHIPYDDPNIEYDAYAFTGGMITATVAGVGTLTANEGGV